MIINNAPEEAREVEDYDITFVSGFCLATISIDRQAGDSIDWDTNPTVVMFHLAEKPAFSDSKLMLPAEEITVYMNHIAVIQKRKRKLNVITPEQKFEFQSTLKKLSRAVN